MIYINFKNNKMNNWEQKYSQSVNYHGKRIVIFHSPSLNKYIIALTAFLETKNGSCKALTYQLDYRYFT